jgi:hypothetical protein
MHVYFLLTYINWRETEFDGRWAVKAVNGTT